MTFWKLLRGPPSISNLLEKPCTNIAKKLRSVSFKIHFWPFAWSNLLWMKPADLIYGTNFQKFLRPKIVKNKMTFKIGHSRKSIIWKRKASNFWNKLWRMRCVNVKALMKFRQKVLVSFFWITSGSKMSANI